MPTIVTSKPDAKLIAEFLQGDRVSVEELVRRYQRPLYFLCMRILSHHEDAVEIVQKTFIAMLEKIDTLQRPNAFKTWLYRIAVNLCHNALREKITYSRVLNGLSVDRDISCDDPLEQEEQKNMVRYSLQKLSEKQKTTVILRIYHDLSYQEIGEILGCQEVTARTHFHLGLKNLAGKLKDFVDES